MTLHTDIPTRSELEQLLVQLALKDRQIRALEQTN